MALPLALLAQPTISALGGGSPGVGGASPSMPAISAADSGQVHVANTFTSGAFVLGQGNSATSAPGTSSLLILGGLAAALFFWFKK